jgi:hypothetical protein
MFYRVCILARCGHSRAMRYTTVATNANPRTNGARLNAGDERGALQLVAAGLVGGQKEAGASHTASPGERARGVGDPPPAIGADQCAQETRYSDSTRPNNSKMRNSMGRFLCLHADGPPRCRVA